MNYEAIADPDWTFTSVIQRPDGLRVEVTIAVPERVASRDVCEMSEVAQMAAVRALQIKTKPPTIAEAGRAS